MSYPDVQDLHVQWTITPTMPPQPRVTCQGCGVIKPFRHSGKVRLNANGKTLDAWLIYRCTACGNTWNRPIFERRNVRGVPPALLEALQSNNSAWINAFAFDIGSMAADRFGDYDIEKIFMAGNAQDPRCLIISLRVMLPCAVRLDRLLAAELKISRARAQGLECASGRPIRDGQIIQIDVADQEGIVEAALK